MYVRRTTRKRKDGSEVGYLQLAHNVWDPKAGHSVVRVVHNFGREDLVNRGAIERLIGSLERWLDPQAPPRPAAGAGPGLRFVESRPIGGAWALDGLWRALAIDRTLERLLDGRRLDPRAERVLFAMVANRALEPLSKLAASFESGSSARLATIAKITRSARGSNLRPSSSRASVRSIFNARQIPSSAHAPPIGRDSTNRSPGPAPAAARGGAAGSNQRSNEPISRSIAARSIRSSRPKLCNTRTTECPAVASHTLCASWR